MSYRPICDTWVLARSKVKYYGAYPAGFLHRARQLLGVHISDPVLHVCSGEIGQYPYDGLGPNDKTLDINPEVNPDFLVDVATSILPIHEDGDWCAVLADPPYTEEDAFKYGDYPLPSARRCLEQSLDVIDIGGRVGILHYAAPRPPSGVKLVALVTVFVGFENRIRLYSVYEKQ